MSLENANPAQWLISSGLLSQLQNHARYINHLAAWRRFLPSECVQKRFSAIPVAQQQEKASTGWAIGSGLPFNHSLGASKHPPAKPEALRLLAPQRGLIATDQNQNWHVARRDVINHTLNGPEKTHCRKCQTFTATPAEPGEFPTELDILHRRFAK